MGSKKVEENVPEFPPKLIYEQKFELSDKTTHKHALEWLNSQQASVESSDPPKYISAFHGTLAKPSVYDPNFRKRMVIFVQKIDEHSTHVRIETEPLYTSGEPKKLHSEWWNGFFSQLFQKLSELEKPKKLNYCPKCGKALTEQLRICPHCGVDFSEV